MFTREQTPHVTDRCADSWFACVATPPGRGALAVIEVHADPALCDAPDDPLFRGRAGSNGQRRRVATLAVGGVAYGEWGPSPAEDVVVVRRAEGVFEIHCHGGVAAIGRILETLELAGVEVLPWTEAIARLNGWIAAETALALSRCLTSAPLSHLLSQHHGAFEGVMSAIRERLDDSPLDVMRRLEQLVAWTGFGLHLTEPWRVVLAGRPNAGKSSLLNAFAGRERAIVSPVPGTTRDVVSVDLALEGWPIRLLDTAGLRESGDALERMGVAAARSAALEADLVLHVRDATDGEVSSPLTIPAGRQTLSVANKADANGARHRPDELVVSAVTGLGLDELARRIVEALVPDPPAVGTPLPVTPLLANRVREWHALARAGDWVALRDVLDASLAHKG
jgi:tRNA modification GTPase